MGNPWPCYNGLVEDAKTLPLAEESARARPSLTQWRTWRAHVRIARLDHWVKNVFVLPGIVVALTLNHLPLSWELLGRSLLGLLAVGLVASSNYVINELCDAPFDRFHPIKRLRPIPSGSVIIPLAYAQWVLLGAAGLWLAGRISPWLGWDLAVLLAMGCAYNLRPLRTKDVPYVDVLTEAINNPLRLLAGWLMVAATVPPLTLLLSYWLVGCYFMALKRFAEYRHLQQDGSVGKYRASLAFFTPELLLYSVVFYAASSMLFSGAGAVVSAGGGGDGDLLFDGLQAQQPGGTPGEALPGVEADGGDGGVRGLHAGVPYDRYAVAGASVSPDCAGVGRVRAGKGNPRQP
jgi:4-hydroxybenzoate polyprenyltransferase